MPKIVLCLIISLAIGLKIYAEDWKEYNDKKSKFVINYPSDWQVKDRPDGVAFLSPKENPQDDFFENVFICVDNISVKRFLPLNDYAELCLKDLSEKHKFFKLLEKGNVKINGENAFYIVASGFGQGKAKSKMYLLNRGSSKLLLTYTAPKDNFHKFLGIAEKIMRSITLLK